MNKVEYSYIIYDDDIGGNVKEQKFIDFDTLYDDIERDVYSYCSDFPEGEEKDDLELHDEKYWSERAVLNSLASFDFLGGLREWVCWFPGHHRKIIVSYGWEKK
jgi:hypothetical protein